MCSAQSHSQQPPELVKMLVWKNSTEGSLPSTSCWRDRSDLLNYNINLEVLDVSQRTSTGYRHKFLRSRESTSFGSETSDCFWQLSVSLMVLFHCCISETITVNEEKNVIWHQTGRAIQGKNSTGLKSVQKIFGLWLLFFVSHKSYFYLQRSDCFELLPV